MTILHAAANGAFFNAVRLVGVGTTGARFVQRFHAEVPASGSPLAQLRDEVPSFIWIEQGEADALLQGADLGMDLGDTRLLLLAFGADMRRAEIEAAMHLAWSMWSRDGHTVAIVIGGKHLRPSQDSMLGILCDAVDARLDVADDSREQMEPVQWLYLGLRRSVMDGSPFLEPAWDTEDIVETLGFCEVELVLRMETFGQPGQLTQALGDALRDLYRLPPGIERAQGMLIVLWAPKELGLTAAEVRVMRQLVNEAMGAGALQLTIRLAGSAPPGTRGVLTLIVSFSRLPISLAPVAW